MIQTLAQSGSAESMIGSNFTAIIFFSFCAGWLLLHFGYKTVRTVTRERTRREIAAYIAEGTMTPEQGERLLKAGESRKS
ncbi:MAG: hypothetical protein ACT4PL_13020 [Phycisphaerales bacterium]